MMLRWERLDETTRVGEGVVAHVRQRHVAHPERVVHPEDTQGVSDLMRPTTSSCSENERLTVRVDARRRTLRRLEGWQSSLYPEPPQARPTS